MDNPYAAPETRVTTQDEKVIELLVRYKYQLKVVNMLRGEGMDYDKAKNLVSQNAIVAQTVLDKENRVWRLIAVIMMLLAILFLILIVYYAVYFNFIAIGILCLFAYGSVIGFRRCDKIKF